MIGGMGAGEIVLFAAITALLFPPITKKVARRLGVGVANVQHWEDHKDE